MLEKISAFSVGVILIDLSILIKIDRIAVTLWFIGSVMLLLSSCIMAEAIYLKYHKKKEKFDFDEYRKTHYIPRGKKFITERHMKRIYERYMKEQEKRG